MQERLDNAIYLLLMIGAQDVMMIVLFNVACMPQRRDLQSIA